MYIEFMTAHTWFSGKKGDKFKNSKINIPRLTRFEFLLSYRSKNDYYYSKYVLKKNTVSHFDFPISLLKWIL